MRNIFTLNPGSCKDVTRMSDASTNFPDPEILDCFSLQAEDDEDDKAAVLSSLAQVLSTVTQTLLTSPSPLRAVFICNVARLIAVAEHSELRHNLATWFQSLVEEADDMENV